MSWPEDGMETNSITQHPTEDLLEQYVAGKLAKTAASLVSTHLFGCDSCYERYELELDFRSAARNAAAAIPLAEPAKESFWSRLSLIPNPALVAAAALALVMMFVVPRWTSNNASPVVAELTAMRGGQAEKPVPAGRPVHLKLNTEGIQTPNLRVELVDASGTAVWGGTAAPENGLAEDVVNRPLQSGTYWVRLYSQHDSDPLREYALNVK